MRQFRIVLSVLVSLLALGPSAGFAQTMKHSGTILSIGDDAATFVLAEVGPWQVRDGATVMTYRTITVTPETRFAIVSRGADLAGGLPGDFVEMRLPPDGVYLNDYVTVDCLHDGKRLIALKITVIEALPPID